MYEFTVPDGDWDYDPDSRRYTHKPLVFTEKKRKEAIATVKYYVDAECPFTMVFTPKEPKKCY